jgi:hypothetical protein
MGQRIEQEAVVGIRDIPGSDHEKIIAAHRWAPEFELAAQL